MKKEKNYCRLDCGKCDKAFSWFSDKCGMWDGLVLLTIDKFREACKLPATRTNALSILLSVPDEREKQAAKEVIAAYEMDKVRVLWLAQSVEFATTGKVKVNE